MTKTEVLRTFLDNGILISPDFLEELPDEIDYKTALEKFNNVKEKIKQEIPANNFLKKTIVLAKPKIEQCEARVNVLFSYVDNLKKKEVSSFLNYFRKRYDKLRDILVNRQSLQDSISISRLERKNQGESISIIGMVLEKSETKNGNIIFKLEDPTGMINVLVLKNKGELFDSAKDILKDEVIGIIGVMGDKIVFVNSIVFPDIPINHELKKSPDEVYAVFISDIHFGIKNFISNDFNKMLSWLNGDYGTEQQREVAKKVRYLFVTGDIVEGVGIYPGQEKDLEIKDIYKQYEEATLYFKKVPSYIKIIICGGNHDAIRMSEPQPVFDKQIAKGFYEIPNMIQVSNPAIVNIHSSEFFPGFNVLMYHGGSFFFISENVSSIRAKGGITRVDMIMKYLLQKRHLSISHDATLYVPDPDSDPLVIGIVPDIFVSGHIHQITVSNYRNITLINSSCWVTQSENQAKRGIVPHPGKIPIINLKTREVKIMDFLSNEEEVLIKNG